MMLGARGASDVEPVSLLQCSDLHLARAEKHGPQVGGRDGFKERAKFLTSVWD